MEAATGGRRRRILGARSFLGILLGAIVALAAALAGGAKTATPAPETAPHPTISSRDPIAEAWARALVDPQPPAPPEATSPVPTNGDSTDSGGPPAAKNALRPRRKEAAPPWARPNTGASSALGVKFPMNPVLPLGKRGSHDSGHAEYPSVVFVGDTAWMYYSAFGARHHWEIAAAQSTDGIHWTKLGSVIVPDTTTSDWDSSTIAFPCVLYSAERAPAERFRMWYAGKSGALYDGIGYATSPNGRDWVRAGRALAAGGDGEWDSSQVVDPTVIQVADGYRMYYCGSRDADGYFQVGLALSADGMNWVKSPENPLVKFEGNPSGAYTLEVLQDPDGYTLFVSLPNSAREFEIYAMRSADGLTFDPAARQIVLAPARDGSWDDQMVYGMEAMEIGGQVYLWFNGIYARSVPKGGEVGLARIARSELERLFAGP
jgi:predicted GH43/DUF377 family glycosyl hydrolase